MEKIYKIEEILFRLKFATKAATWKDLADFLGEKEGTLSAWKTNNRQSCVTKILYKSRGIVSDTWLLTGEGPMLEQKYPLGGEALKEIHEREIAEERTNITAPPHDNRQAIKVPLISWVQAGDWHWTEDPLQPGDADEWLETTATSSAHAFALAVHGDSMAPEFNPGDLIVVDPERRAENGSYVIAKNGKGEATFKKLVVDGSSVFLQPLNDRYPIRDMTGVEFKVIGVVSEKRKRY